MNKTEKFVVIIGIICLVIILCAEVPKVIVYSGMKEIQVGDTEIMAKEDTIAIIGRKYVACLVQKEDGYWSFVQYPKEDLWKRE